MELNDNTQPVRTARSNEVAPPPRLLLWLVVGAFVVALVGGAAGLYVFRNVLRPGQQQRIIDTVPFMEAFLNRPNPDQTLPTAAAPANSGIDPNSLLNAPLFATEEAEAEATEAPTAEATETAEPTLEAASLSLASYTRTQFVPLAKAEPVAAPAQQDPPPATEVSAVSQRPNTGRLYGFTHVQQTWNNCGPANITMALSYYGWREDQSMAASLLKPDREDKNVSPSELVNFVNSNTGVRAITRLGGDLELLKQFIANGFPVIIETGYTPEGYDWIGHYQTVVGYDDNQRIFYIYDSYLGSGQNGEGISQPYADFDRHWQAFNRVFIVIYEQDRESLVAEILGERADVQRAAEMAFEVAQQEARANPQNEYAWFNMGTSLTKLGRYEEAAAAYDRATQIGLHFRMLWYQFGPFEAYYNVGRYDDVLALANANLNSGGEYVEETYYWQGMAYEALGETQQAASALQQAVSRNPLYSAAQDALNQLSA